MKTNKTYIKAFTLLEMILVIAIIAILAGIVIIAINPGRQLAQARNAQRASDLKTIYNAVQQYYIDNKAWPTTTMPTNLTEVCDENNEPTGCLDLSNLVPDYLPAIPTDPQSTTGTNYKIAINPNTQLPELTAPSSTEYDLDPVQIGTTTLNDPIMWAPTDLVSLALWLDASDSLTMWQDTAGTIPAANGNAVARWDDKSGLSRNMLQTTSSLRPVLQFDSLNNMNAIYFTNDMLKNSFSASQPNNIIMVAKYDSTYGYLFDGISTNNRNALYGGSTHRLYCGGTEPLYSGGTAWKIFSPVFNGNSTRHYVNGNVGGTTGTGTQNLIGLSLGSRYTASEFFIGKIAEVIVISGEDNNESRQLAEGYLAHKWGLEGSLPTGHPYKDFPPTK